MFLRQVREILVLLARMSENDEERLLKRRC